VLDARAIGDGPIATCRFDHAIPRPVGAGARVTPVA
jgi:hypothetical protein